MGVATIKDLKEGKPFYLRCPGKNLVVTAWPASVHDSILANQQEYNDYSFFKFDLVDVVKEIYLIQCLGHKTIVSAVGEGWPLYPKVEDAKWAEFKFQQSNYNPLAINIQSAHPIANTHGNGSWVSVVGARQEVRVCETKPRKDWSDFIPFLKD